MKKIIFVLLCSIFAVLLPGCFAGFSRLPEINFLGKSREETVRILASNPQKAWGTHINICTPLKNGNCGNNLYFKTVEEALADKHIQQAWALRGYFTRRLFSTPEANDFYEVIFDESGKVISQETSHIQDAM